jgi:hypothetical protein
VRRALFLLRLVAALVLAVALVAVVARTPPAYWRLVIGERP